MKNIILIFLLCLFILSTVTANLIGISPSEIKILGKPGEIICKNFELIGNGTFFSEIKWSYNYTKNLKDYNLSNLDLKISANYPKGTKEGNKLLCLSSDEKIFASGALLYKVENQNYGIGTWIVLNISDENPPQKDILLNGRVISNLSSLKIYSFDFLFITICTFFIILLICVKYLFKKKD